MAKSLVNGGIFIYNDTSDKRTRFYVPIVTDVY